MRGVVDSPPAARLFVGVDARRVDIALALLRNLRGLGDEQAGAGALPVIIHHQIVGRVGSRRGAIARQRRHHDAVGEMDVAEIVGLEQFFGVVRGHGGDPGCCLRGNWLACS